MPPELLPEDGRFGVGPSKIPFAAVKNLALSSVIGTSHRQPPVRSLVSGIQEKLSELLVLPDGYQVVLGNGGATAFWDVATSSLIEQRSLHLAFGEFGAKFAGCAAQAPFLEQPVVVEAPAGQRAPEVRDFGNCDVAAWPHNETSTGVMMPVRRPAGDGLVLIDGTSAAGAVAFDAAQADAYYFSLQKAFASEGGLWVACLSPAAVERAERIDGSGRWIPDFLSLQKAIDNSRLHQTYNTPALITLLLLDDQLEWMIDLGGLEAAEARSCRSAEIIYSWAESCPLAEPFVADPASRSITVATIDFSDEVDALKIAARLRENGIVDVEPYRKLGRNQLRVSLFPAVDPEDVRKLTGCIDWLLDQAS